jgi:hypothetical protein
MPPLAIEKPISSHSMDECATDPCQHDCPDNDGTLSGRDLPSSQNPIDARPDFN